MSEFERCDVCGAEAMRCTSRWAPEGWRYGFVSEDESGERLVAMVCSASCAERFWSPWDSAHVLDRPQEKLKPTHLRERLHCILEAFTVPTVLATLARVVSERQRWGKR